MQQSLDQVKGSCSDCVGRRSSEHGDFGGWPDNGVSNPLCGHFMDPDLAASTVIGGWPNVPCTDSMRGPSFLEIRLFMSWDSGSRWGQESATAVEGSVDLCPS